MSYFDVHILYLLLPAVFLARRYSERDTRWSGRTGVEAIACLVVIATVWTTPWDNLMLWLGVWTYPPEVVMGRIFLVPIEEHTFFVAQPILVGLLTLWVLRDERRPPARSRRARLAGALLAIGMTWWAAWNLSGTTYYLAATLVWFAPAIGLQWWAGGDLLLQRASRLLPVFVISTVYLSLIDALALEERVWSISDTHTIGVAIGGVPLEEIVFFGVTSALVIGGVTLYVDLKRGTLW